MPESTRSSPSADAASRDHSTWVVILAGGIGSRFWPVSTRERPKQLLPLGSDRPLIVDAVERARALAPDARLRILAGSHLTAAFRRALPDLPESCYWIEPDARGTAPVLAWAARRIAAEDEDAVMVSMHADHRIEPVQALVQTVRTAVEVAGRDDRLLAIGVLPDRVETGFGHMEPGAPIDASGPADAYEVLEFHEKPDEETARAYMEAGFLWNTGIFVWKASVLLEEVERHAPKIAAALAAHPGDDAGFFATAPVSVVDREIMERSDRVGTVVALFTWDDVGSWEALSRTRSADDEGNVVVGPGRVADASGNIVFADGGDEVYVLGAHDLVVVRSGPRTLVMPRAKAAKLKELLAEVGVS